MPLKGLQQLHDCPPFGVLGIATLVLDKKGRCLETGWYEGFVILVAFITLIVCHSICDFWHETRHKLSEKEHFNMTETFVQVFRGGCQLKLSISDLVMCDIVVLKRGYQVPTDGLYVSDEVLELEDHLEFIHRHNHLYLRKRINIRNGSNGKLV